jgi:hypothetical protein
MILREVALPRRYAVYAVCGFPTDEHCEVEDFLLLYRHSYPKAVRDLNTLLRDYTPQHGPPFENDQVAKRLREGICEFKASQKRKKKCPRILFFEDGKLIICTNAFLKDGSTPDSEIDRAIQIRGRYFRHQPEILKGWGVSV